MASDDKTLRIEAHLQETIEVQSAGDATRDEAIRQQQSIEPPPQASSSLGTEEDVRRRIEAGDDSPLPEAVVAAGAQAGAQAATAGSAAPVVAGAGAGAVAAGGAAGGAAGAGGLAAAGAAAAAALGPVGIAAGIAVAGIAAMTAATVAAEAALSRLQESLLKEFEEVSPTLSIARAEQEQALLMKRLELENQIAGEGGNFISDQTALMEQVMEIKVQIIEIIAPLLRNLMRIMQVILSVIERILALINWFQEKFLELQVFITAQLEKLPLIGPVFGKINDYLEGILKAVKEEDTPDPFQQEAIDFLTGATFKNRQMNPFKFRGFRSNDKRKPPRKP